MRELIPIGVAVVLTGRLLAGPYAPAAGQAGTTAVAASDPGIVAWVSAVGTLERGPQQLGDPALGNATQGSNSDAIGPATASLISPTPVVSLGDGGWITLLFGVPITDRQGSDFAVFENSFSDFFLELAFVEVSSDGLHFERFDAISLTPADTQVNGDDAAGPFGTLDPTNLNNLAGKYRAGFGTPFDLSELVNRPGLDVTRITHVRVRDAVGSIDPLYATYDSQGRIINDPWATPYDTSGFDLDGIAVIHQIPEPGAASLLTASLILLGLRHRRASNEPRSARRIQRM